MKLHEFQSKEILRRYQVPTPEGEVTGELEAARRIIESTKKYPLVVKAQILAGGRGKGGGVRVCRDRAEALAAAEAILGMNLVTPQTGDQGQQVRQILLEQGVAIAQEFYLSLVVDRAGAGIAFLASRAGGMAIEELAAEQPELVVKVRVDPLAGLAGYHLRQLAFGLGLPPELHKEFGALCRNLYHCFTACDCLLLEINPLVLTAGTPRFIALDAKLEIDDNALFRRPELAALRDPAEESEPERRARSAGLNYIGLKGNIASMVNGAGLAMATMDLIKQAGGEPANFLDVGGGASAAMVEEGLRIILDDPGVEAVLINIFGGILRCDILAQGVVEAARRTAIKVPLIVRMEGTNVEEGRRILADSGLELITAADLSEVGQALVALVGDRPSAAKPPTEMEVAANPAANQHNSASATTAAAAENSPERRP